MIEFRRGRRVFRAAALAALGPALLADWRIAEDLRSGALADAPPDWTVALDRFETTVYPSRALPSGETRAALDFFRDALTPGSD